MRPHMFDSRKSGTSIKVAELEDTTLRKLALRIGASRPERADSGIPAGATYLAQFAVHDLDFQSVVEPGITPAGNFDLALIYGDGPKHHACSYQLPSRPGDPRYLLRLGRTRWAQGAAGGGCPRDLPRASGLDVDDRAPGAVTEVLIPNALSDANALLAQVHTVWALLHNAIAESLARNMAVTDIFVTARDITRGIYRNVLRHDVLGTWLHKDFRDRYMYDAPKTLGAAGFGRPTVEFMSGVGRIGHCMSREIYTLNDRANPIGLNSVIRHTGSGRPFAMPITGDWLVDFSKFFAIGGSVPQMARAIGPHVARAFANLDGGTASFPADGLVLSDLAAGKRDGVLSVGSLVELVEEVEPGLLAETSAASQQAQRQLVANWLARPVPKAAEFDRDEAALVTEAPPLLLFLMLEAEQDAGGQTLGPLGSIMMGETFAAALTTPAPSAEIAAASHAVFGEPEPATMEQTIIFLQKRYGFDVNTQLCPAAFTRPAQVDETAS